MKRLNKDNLIYIGDIFFSEFPSTQVYYDSFHNVTWVVEWYSLNHINDNMYFAYNVDKTMLTSFLNKEIGHYEMMEQGENYYHYIDDFYTITKIEFNSIDRNTLPEKLCMFDGKYSDQDSLNDVLKYLKNED